CAGGGSPMTAVSDGAVAERIAKTGTLPKLLRLNGLEHPRETALREKDLGIWRTWTWGEYLSLVREITLGLTALGGHGKDVVALIGDNRPFWIAAEIASHALGAYSLGLYRDALEDEIDYLVNYGAARIIFVEDEEQVDKLLNLQERLPTLAHIVYADPRG